MERTNKRIIRNRFSKINSANFAFRMKGESMKGDGIFHGDLVVARKQDPAWNGRGGVCRRRPDSSDRVSSGLAHHQEGSQLPWRARSRVLTMVIRRACPVSEISVNWTPTPGKNT